MKNTKRPTKSLLAAHTHARGMLSSLCGTARYWARDARRCRVNGAHALAAVSLDLMRTDRRLASEWRAEVKRLAALLA